MTISTHTLTIPLVAASLTIAGCGITNPYQTSRPAATPATTPSVSTSAPSTAQDPSDRPPGSHSPEPSIPSAAAAAQNELGAGAGEPSPQAALERYAQLYTNWTSSTLGAIQRELASISLDQARAQALQAAASYTNDTVLQQSKVANAGTVVSIAAGQAAAHGQWVIVTSETTTGQGDYRGLPPTVHVTYAQLTHTRHGWIVSAWNPQT
jgi:hypothetical protein